MTHQFDASIFQLNPGIKMDIDFFKKLQLEIYKSRNT